MLLDGIRQHRSFRRSIRSGHPAVHRLRMVYHRRYSPFPLRAVEHFPMRWYIVNRSGETQSCGQLLRRLCTGIEKQCFELSQVNRPVEVISLHRVDS